MTKITFIAAPSGECLLVVVAVATFIDPVTFTFNLLTSNKTNGQDLSYNIHLPSLVMICPEVFGLSAHTHPPTHTHTHTHTHRAAKRHTHASNYVGVTKHAENKENTTITLKLDR